ncbi:MAG: acyl-CoA dehydrogenase family protein, partial [Candidatus Krumholzibacteriia bacterium]
MIDFSLTEEQRQLRDLAHDFAANEIRPVAAEFDEREEFAWEVAKKGAALGLSGVALGGHGAE